MQSLIKPGRQRKVTPNENHPYIVHFLSIIYNKQIIAFNEIVENKIFITKQSLIESNALQIFNESGLLEEVPHNICDSSNSKDTPRSRQ